MTHLTIPNTPETRRRLALIMDLADTEITEQEEQGDGGSERTDNLRADWNALADVLRAEGIRID